MNTYSVHVELRKHYRFVVRMNGGYTMARCQTAKDAETIAATLNEAAKVGATHE